MAAKPSKRCFVTIGATAAFDSLLHAILAKDFLQALKSNKYTHLRLQYGALGGRILDDFLASPEGKAIIADGLELSGFDFNRDGLSVEMREAKGGTAKAEEGVVISHAGSGSILDAFRVNVPLIVVPNATLLDNHQEELAEELARQGYVVHARIDNLATALHEVEARRSKRTIWLPINQRSPRYQRGLAQVMDEEMGFVD